MAEGKVDQGGCCSHTAVHHSGAGGNAGAGAAAADGRKREAAAGGKRPFFPLDCSVSLACAAGGLLRLFGKNSLYLYLLHPFLYYQIAGRVSLGAAGSFIAAFGSAVLGAWLFSRLWKAVSAKGSAVRKKGERR